MKSMFAKASLPLSATLLSALLAACGGGGTDASNDSHTSATTAAAVTPDARPTTPPVDDGQATEARTDQLGVEGVSRADSLAAAAAAPAFTIAKLKTCPLGTNYDNPSLASLPCLQAQYSGKVYEERYTNGGSFRRYTGQQCTVTLRADNTLTLRIGSVAFTYNNNETPTMMAANTYYNANEAYPQTGEGDPVSAYFFSGRYVYKKDGSAEYQAISFNAFEHESDGPGGWYLDTQALNRYTITTPQGRSQEYRYTVGCWGELK